MRAVSFVASTYNSRQRSWLRLILFLWFCVVLTGSFSKLTALVFSVLVTVSVSIAFKVMVMATVINSVG